jgi:type I restriction enzyme S subunit
MEQLRNKPTDKSLMGWNKKKLKDLASINYGKSPKGVVADDGDIPVVGTGGVERYGNSYLYDGESIILGRKGTIDNPVYVNGKFWAIDTTFFLSDFKDADVTWLYYYLRTIDFRSMNEATGVPSVSRDFLYAIEVDAPRREDQAQIAAVLSCIDRAIEHTEAVVAKQQRLKTGLMQDLLTKGIDEHGNIRSEETHEFKESPLGRIPNEWSVSGLKDKEGALRSYIRTGPFGSSLKGEHWVNYGVPVVTIGSLGEGAFIGSELFYITETKARALRSYVLESGDVVFSRVADVGRAVVVTGKEQGWIMSSNLMRISLDKDLADPFYTYLCIAHSSKTRDQIRQLVNAGGRDVANSDVLNCLIFAWPLIDEQKRISIVAKQLDEVIRAERCRTAKLQDIKAGLMQDLLTGKVSVEALLDPEHCAVQA